MTKAKQEELSALRMELEDAQDSESFVKQAETVLDKMRKDMPKGMGWLDRMKEEISERLYVMSEIGRPRRLFRVMTGVSKSTGEAGRRAKNSPIQGISSEIGVVSCHLSYENCAHYSKRIRTKLISKASRVVHDATYFCTPYKLVLPQIQIGLWSSTFGVSEFYKKHFDFTMLSNPEVELEMCSREDKSYKWDWSIPELAKIIRKSLEDQKGLGLLDDVQEAMEEIFWCWTDKTEREYLFNSYPFLGVPYEGVKNQVRLALKEQNLL
jgi:hypothetical protein